MRHAEVELSPEKKAALYKFDDEFEEALSELFVAEVSEFEIGYYFGPTLLSQYIFQRLMESKQE